MNAVHRWSPIRQLIGPLRNGPSRARQFAVSLIATFLMHASVQAAPVKLPYVAAGLNKQQAAAVLLSRFTYGPRPGEVETLTKQGLSQWFEQQLQVQPETELATRLTQFPAVGFTHRQLFSTFPSNAQITAQARRAYDLVPPADVDVDFTWVSRKMTKFRDEQGWLPQDGLYQQLTGQKILRAVYAQNQLNEVLTDFWQNHFYTSTSNFRSRVWVLAYENEAIRPYATGRFRELLGASAKHPAKVQATLGDAQKSTLSAADTTMGLKFAGLKQTGNQASIDAIKQQLQSIATEEDLLLQKRFWPATGANLEYARL